MAAKGKLNDTQRKFIVEMLATYHGPEEIVKAVREEFGLEITRQNVLKYDPSKISGQSCAKKWREIYASTRSDFLKNAALRVPTANKAVRLQRLDRMAAIFERKGNFIAAARILEQIAKETGGSYSNLQRREHTGRDGGPIQTEEVRQMTDEQLDQHIMGLLGVSPADQHKAPGEKQ